MSDECYLYGAILGAFGTVRDWHSLYERNADTIASLPDEDSEPPLTRGMFCRPARPGDAGLYRYQVIHFGASFNGFADDWHHWLEKFEGLLKKLYWFSVHLHLHAGVQGGEHDYRWEVKRDQLDRMRRPEPVPPGLWEFSGGPRRFGV